MVGTVSGIKRERGFFFICGPDNRDYFALATDLPNHQSLNSLTHRVTCIEFTPEERPKGPAAINLRVLTPKEADELIGTLKAQQRQSETTEEEEAAMLQKATEQQTKDIEERFRK